VSVEDLLFGPGIELDSRWSIIANTIATWYQVVSPCPGIPSDFAVTRVVVRLHLLALITFSMQKIFISMDLNGLLPA
jgi:hypothetical protein